MQSHPQSNDPSTAACPQSKILGQVTLEPRKMSRLVVDITNPATTEIHPQIEIKPNKPENVGITLQALRDDKVTTFIYHFQNFSDHICQVTVRAAS